MQSPARPRRFETMQLFNLVQILLLSACLVGSPAEAEAQSDPARNDVPLVWTGKLLDPDPSQLKDERKMAFDRAQREALKAIEAELEAGGPRAYAEILRRDLARARLSLKVGELTGQDVDREFSGLMARAARRDDYPGRWDVLIEIRLALAQYV